MPDSAWFIGSATIPQIDMANFDGDDITVPAGTYYLRHTTAALSLLDVFNTAIDASVSSITCTSLFIRRDRRVQINLSGVAEINFSSAAVNGDILANLLGFVGDQTGASSYVATHVSPLLWSPGFPATPTTISGVEGYSVDDKVIYRSQDGSQSVTYLYNSAIYQEWSWGHVVPERLRITGTAPADGGTFHAFYEGVYKLGRRFFWYPSVSEDDGSSTIVSWGSGIGPYVRRSDTGDWYKRNVANAEVSSPLELNGHIVDEVS
jgi:hypothetical protein